MTIGRSAPSRFIQDVRATCDRKRCPRNWRNGRSALVLLVADLFHPLHRLAVERLLDGDVGHGGGGRGAMPMFLARREDHDVARTNLLDRAAFALRPAAAHRDDEDLTERVRMPGGARSRLERDRVAGPARGSGYWKQRIDADHSGEIFRRPLGRWARTRSLDVHPLLLMWRGRRAPAVPMARDFVARPSGLGAVMSLFGALRP